MEKQATRSAAQASVTATVREIVSRDRIPHRRIEEAFGVSRAWVARRLAGTVEWTAAELVVLAPILGVDVIDLYGAAVSS